MSRLTQQLRELQREIDRLEQNAHGRAPFVPGRRVQIDIDTRPLKVALHHLEKSATELTHENLALVAAVWVLTQGQPVHLPDELIRSMPGGWWIEIQKQAGQEGATLRISRGQ